MKHTKQKASAEVFSGMKINKKETVIIYTVSTADLCVHYGADITG